MDEVCGQSKLFASDGQSVRLPVAHMVCNQVRGADGRGGSVGGAAWEAQRGGGPRR